MNTSGGYADFDFAADFYDHVAFAQERADLDFYIASANEFGGPVLELGCGTGRVLLPVARAGFEIVGLDIARNMLEICRARVLSEPEETQKRIELVHQSMCGFNLDRTFGLIITPFRSFQALVTVPDQIACLASIHRHMDADSRLILDLFNPHPPVLMDDSGTDEFGEEPPFTMPDGRRVIMRYRNERVDRAEQIISCEMIYYVKYPDGTEERLVQAFPLRYLFRYEVEHLLARVGFSIENIWGGYDRTPFGTTDPGEMIVCARKMG